MSKIFSSHYSSSILKNKDYKYNNITKKFKQCKNKTKG